MRGGQHTRPSWSERLRHFAFHKYFLMTRAMTMGVRALVLDAQGRVFLVRHTYVGGWHLPGGGVELGETLLQSLERELAEEANIAMQAEPLLLGLYFNRHASRRDHVAVYVVRQFQQSAPRLPDREIAEAGFFHVADLPAETTHGTRQRIAEALDTAKISADW